MQIQKLRPEELTKLVGKPGTLYYTDIDGVVTHYLWTDGAFQPAAGFTAPQVTALQAVVSEYGNAPATLNATTAAAYNGATMSLAAAATLTVHDGAWDLLSAGVVIQVGQGGSATLAFSGTATKENASGTSASSVTLAACGVYALTQSPSGSPKFRLSGGASL